MIKVNKIPSREQLIEIAESVNKTLDNVKKDNLYIVFQYDIDTIRKIDEDFFYKNSEGEKNNYIPGDEVQLDVLGVKFKFIESDGDNPKKQNR